MPPKKIRVVPRNAPSPARPTPQPEPPRAVGKKNIRVVPRNSPPATEPVQPPASEKASPKRIAEQLRERTSLLDAADLAGVLRFRNRKRVYELPITRTPLGPTGGALRWDPIDVAEFLERQSGDAA